MAIQTGNLDLDNRINDLLTSLVSSNIPSGNLLSNETRIREAAFHDFSYYQFLLSPHYIRRVSTSLYPGDEGTVDGTDVSIGVWLEFENFVDLFETDVHGTVGRWIQVEEIKEIKSDDEYVQYWYEYGWSRQRRTQQVAFSAKEGFRLGMAPALFELYTVTTKPDLFLLDAYDEVSKWFYNQLVSLKGADGIYDEKSIFSVREASFWEKGVGEILGNLSQYQPTTSPPENVEEDFGEKLPEQYSFEPFMPGSVNFGLQAIYRQGWIPLGTQPGEIIRTLPLGPKQSEKVTIKAVRRTKATRQTEISSSIETATESSAATKDSSEVIQEASESFNWHVEATASASFGFGSASLTAGAGGENSSASKDTKSRLNETMEKTSSKIRKDTKIVVTTEVEETSEFTQVSEITNPNDEIAVTYIYSRLQRQYEIQTYLAEVNTVVFIAEHMPAPGEITGPWIRRYDWIIARELLDESFRSDLNVVRNHEREVLDSDDIDSNIQRLMQTFSGNASNTAPGLPNYARLEGQLPDIFQNPQHAYERELERKRARESDNQQYRRSVRRLRAHIYDNILHYCRAIWASEDPDARLLRYQKIRVPIRWEYAATGRGRRTTKGYFSPSVRDISLDTAPLSDMINPAGPIGFAGNYAVFYLKQSSRWNSLLQMLRVIQAPFLKVNVKLERGAIADDVAIRVAVSDNIAGPGRYRLSYAQTDTTGTTLKLYEERAGNNFVYIKELKITEKSPVTFLGIRLWLSGIDSLQVGDIFEIRVTTEQTVEDPELKALRWSIPPLADEGKATFFTNTVINDMREYFSDVYNLFLGRGSGVTWDALNDNEKSLLTERYYDYLLRSRHTRRLLLDTNNVLLTREVDDATTLEPFKGLHRIIDVLSASEELTRTRLENNRRKLRIDNNRLGDPEIEKVTVVAAGKNLASLAALDGLEEDPEVGGETNSQAPG